jgi:hypothetical protein
VVVVALGFGGGGSLPVGAQEEADTGAPETPDGGPAIDELVGCVQASQQLLVLFLIDESASLKESDPGDRRVDAAQGALDSLVSLATSEGAASPEVDIAMAAFANEYRPIQDWTRADAETAPVLRDALAGFADLDSGIDTDFVNALDAGQESLADRSATVTETGGVAPCRAVLLFTDGGFDLAVRESAEDQERLGTTKPYAPGIELTTPEAVLEAEAAGRTALCEEGGVADRLRADRITLLTVALSGNVARRSQLPLAAATTGRADDYTCGSPSERPSGAYLPAEGVDVLVARFNEVGVRLAGGNPYPGEDAVVVCGEDPCDEGTRTFALDASLRRAQILALPPEPGAVVRLEAPDGSTVDLSEPGDATIGDQALVVRSVAGRGLNVDLVRADGATGWEGEWSVSILDPTGEQEGEDATLQIFVFSDITVSLEGGPVERGGSADFTVALAAPEGVELADLVATTEGELRIRNPITGENLVVPLEGPAQGPFTGTVAVPDDLTANAVEASALVRITSESGAEIVSQSAPTEVFVRRPGGAIQILPPSLKMPSLTGDGATATDLLLLGGEQDGCVWFGEVDVPTAPEGATPLTATIDGAPLPDEGSCISVPAGETVTVVVEIEPSGRASGSVSGTLQVFERTDGAAEASSTDLLFRFDLARGVDEAQRILLAVGLLVAGLALPMLALLVINALTARFQTLDVVQGAALPVQVAQGVVSRTDGPYARSLKLREADFGSLAGRGTARRFSFGGVTFRARASRNPFGATIALAAPEGGAEKLKGNEGSRVELDPGLAGSWVFLLDPGKTRRAIRGDAEGLLIAFVAEGDVAAQVDRMLPDINRRLPETASRLAALVRSSTPKPAKRSKARAAASTEGGEADGDEPTEVDAPSADDAAPADDELASPPAADPTDQALDAPTGDGPAGDDAADEESAVAADGAGDAGAPPAAPLGFGGAAAAAPPVVPLPSGDDGDDGPAAPPAGFTGGRPG